MSWLDAQLITIGHISSGLVSIDISVADPDGFLMGAVTVDVTPWRGGVKGSFLRGELRRFASEIEKLYENLVGPAEFSPMEGFIELKFMGDGRGHITVTGIARDDWVGQNYLAFEIGLDQTELPDIATALRAADPV